MLGRAIVASIFGDAQGKTDKLRHVPSIVQLAQPLMGPLSKQIVLADFSHVYFGKIHSILKPGGLALNHGITHNWLGGRSLGSGIGQFVEEYVFPGGELASGLGSRLGHVLDAGIACGATER